MKTFMVNLSLLAILFSFSRCEIDLSGFSFPPTDYSGMYSNINFTPVYNASFYIDSMRQISTTELTIWTHIQYDSILIIKNQKIEYGESGGNLNTQVIQNVPDTLDFRKLNETITGIFGRKEWIYKYSVTLRNLKKGVDYSACILTDYTEKTNVMFNSQCVGFRLQ